MRYYILDGHEPKAVNSYLDWDSFENVHVSKTEIGDISVSTVFLGVDHSFGEGSPVLFETMIFGGEHDGYQERYCTWDEAEAGHARAVELVNSTQKNVTQKN